MLISVRARQLGRTVLRRLPHHILLGVTPALVTMIRHTRAPEAPRDVNLVAPGGASHASRSSFTVSQPVLSTPAVPEPPAPPSAAPSCHLVRLPVDKPQAAVAFLRARSRGVMDLIAHFWEGLAQTGPLQRGDFHLVAVLENASCNQNINISLLEHAPLAGAMLYVPKAHRADVLALTPAVAAALASYICHQGARAVHAYVPAVADSSEHADKPVEWGEPIASLSLTDLTGRQPQAEVIPAELPAKSMGNGGSGAGATNGSPSGNGTGAGSGGGGGGGGNGGVLIDFLTGEANAIAWMTPLLLPLVHKRTPARQLINVVMQLPVDVPCALHPRVRPARESDVPTLNRWRRLYKEERGIHFDADMDALVQNQRVFVYDLPTEVAISAEASSDGSSAPGTTIAGGVVAVAKIDLDLADLVEIGGVYTFPEHRQHGYGATLMGDMACRIRQSGKVPTLQVDEANLPALHLYEKLGWHAMGKLARVWLTG